jgi:hypothetical protein
MAVAGWLTARARLAGMAGCIMNSMEEEGEIHSQITRKCKKFTGHARLHGTGAHLDLAWTSFSPWTSVD